jgi:hypothetical protein
VSIRLPGAADAVQAEAESAEGGLMPIIAARNLSPRNLMALARHCTRREEGRSEFSRRLMENLSVPYRRFRWSMRPNTGKVLHPVLMRHLNVDEQRRAGVGFKYAAFRKGERLF